MDLILKLTLKKGPFEVMEKYEKKIEYRKPSKWIDSRLRNKDGTFKKYDFVHFANGYGKNVPQFTAKFVKTRIASFDYIVTFSNGLKVDVEKGDYLIEFKQL